MGYSPTTDIPLSAFGVPTADIPMNSHKFTNLADGTGAGNSAGWDQLPLLTNQYAYVATGCVWTADAAGSTRNGSMSSGTVVVAGLVYTVGAVVAHTFTASKDTYVDINIVGGAAVVNYTEVSNNQTSPALVSSGTQYNTVRVAIVVTAAGSIAAAGNINQGSPAWNAATAISTTTVAAGSNGAAFNATPLNVASVTGYPTAGFLVVAHAQNPVSLQYTGISGSTFTGVSAFGLGAATGTTLSTGDVVTSVVPIVVTDTLGNLIFPTMPYPRVIGYAGLTNGSFSTTNASATNTPVVASGNGQPGCGLACPFIIPAGPSRTVKVIAHLTYLQSSAAAGTACQTVIQVGGSAVANSQFKVAVASDGQPVHPEGVSLLAPGSYVAQVAVNQSAAGTLTSGVTYLISAVYVQLV